MGSRPRLPRRPVTPSLGTRALAALRPALASRSPPLWVQPHPDPSSTPWAPDSADPAHPRSPVPPRLPGQPSSARKTPSLEQKPSLLVEAELRRAAVIVLAPSPGQGASAGKPSSKSSICPVSCSHPAPSPVYPVVQAEPHSEWPLAQAHFSRLPMQCVSLLPRAPDQAAPGPVPEPLTPPAPSYPSCPPQAAPTPKPFEVACHPDLTSFSSHPFSPCPSHLASSTTVPRVPTASEYL